MGERREAGGIERGRDPHLEGLLEYCGVVEHRGRPAGKIIIRDEIPRRRNGDGLVSELHRVQPIPQILNLGR